MSEFNEMQKKAILHKDGPLLIIAGPGSGKTTVIVNRAKALVEEYKIKPGNILVSTFTKNAALEMAARYYEICPPGGRGINFGTIHSICLHILREYFGYSYENLCAENEKYGKLYDIYKRYRFQTGDERQFIKAAANTISTIKNMRKDIHDPDTFAGVNGIADEQMERMYFGYQDKLKKEGKYDFDDILLHCHDKLLHEPAALEQLQERYQYIMVDEFQDTNRVQADIFYLIAEKYRNIAIVGDDDQSLYRFRAADPSIMLGFRQQYPDAEKVVLGMNYRSDGNIVKVSRSFIESNAGRFPKDLKANRATKEPIRFVEIKDEKAETAYIIDAVKDLHDQGVSYSEMAVIYRTNKESQSLIAGFMEHKIPFYAKKEDIIDIYNHFIYKDILNFYDIANGSKNYSKWQRAMKRPTLYISGECFRECKNVDDIIEWQMTKGNRRSAKGILQFQEKVRVLKSFQRPKDFIAYLRYSIGYDKGLENYAKYMHESMDLLNMILEDLAKDAEGFNTMKDWIRFGEQYHNEIVEQTKWDKSSDAVSLTTMHGSKGLEYKAVFMVNAIDGVTPNKNAESNEDYEEERRMFYVGMTRAKDKLFLFYPKTYLGKDTKKSPYYRQVMEICKKRNIPTQYLEGKYNKNNETGVKNGDVLYHDAFGEGTVLDINGKKIYLVFGNEFKIFAYPDAILEKELKRKEDTRIMRPDGYMVVLSKKLSKPGKMRYVVIDPTNGEVIRDCSGYGYKTADTAFHIKIRKKAAS